MIKWRDNIVFSIFLIVGALTGVLVKDVTGVITIVSTQIICFFVSDVMRHYRK